MTTRDRSSSTTFLSFSSPPPNMAVDRKLSPSTDDKRSADPATSDEGTPAPPPAYAESTATSTTQSSVAPPSVLAGGSASQSHAVDLEAQRPAPSQSTPLIPQQQQPQRTTLQQGHQVLILRPEYPGASRRATKRFFTTLLWAIIVYLAACLVTGLFVALVIGDGPGRDGRHRRHGGPGKDWDWDGDWLRIVGSLSFVVRR